MAKYDIYSRGVTTDQGTPASPSGSMPAAGLVPAGTFTIVCPFTASGTDITVFNAAVPFKMMIVDSYTVFTTAVNSATVTIRTATGGGGTALSSAHTSTGSASKQRDALTTAPQTINADTSIYLNKSDAGLAGHTVITVVPVQ